MILNFPLSIWMAPLLAFILSFVSIRWLITQKPRWILDHPNTRSLHVKPVPRVGGLGLLFGMTAAWLFLPAILPDVVWIGMALLAVISFADDVWRVSVRYRLLMQGIAAVSFSLAVISGEFDWFFVTGVTIAIIWMTNLYNFMDGSDGLAGGMAVIGFGYYGLCAYLMGNTNFALINFSVAAAAAAFLMHNFHPARIFLGDAGAIPLGYLAAVLGVLGWMEQIWSLWLPLLVFSPFIADATVTLIRRLLRGEIIWQAHCEHYYQRMVQSGLGHRNTALLGYALMLLVGGSALWVAEQDMVVQNGIALTWGCLYLFLMFISDRHLKNHHRRA